MTLGHQSSGMKGEGLNNLLSVSGRYGHQALPHSILVIEIEMAQRSVSSPNQLRLTY